MNISENLQRIQEAKANIKTAIENKGVTVGNTKLDGYANLINQIQTGGGSTGGGTEREIILSDGDSFDFNFKIKLKDLYQKTTFQFYGEVDDPANPGEGFKVTFNINVNCDNFNNYESRIYINNALDPYGNQFDIQCDGEWFYFKTTSGGSCEIIYKQINLPIYYI